MKVRHLIEKLKVSDPEALVLLNRGGNMVEVGLREDEAVMTDEGYEFLSNYTNLGEMEDLLLKNGEDHLAFFSVVIIE